MAVIDDALKHHLNTSGPREITGSLNKSFKRGDHDSNINPDSIFVINDIDLVVPPTQITVRKENLHWSWKTLRTNISTKIPSGSAITQVNLNIVFTPDLVLHLHRLVTQFKHSPFCTIKNKFLRHSICPDWPQWQEMAFTMNSINVTNMSGYPGTFLVQLELRWFNYMCYTPNFLYRQEYETVPIKMNLGKDKGESTFVRKTIQTVSGPNLEKKDTILSYSMTADLEDWSRVKEDFRNKKLSLHDLVNTHAGTSFDLMPLPQNMERSIPVPCRYSNIYTRYINDLQMKALYENFDIDVWATYKRMGREKEFPYLTVGKTFLSGGEENKSLRSRVVFGIQTGVVPEAVRFEIIKMIFSSTEILRIIFDEYATHEENAVVKNLKFDLRKKIAEGTLSANPRALILNENTVRLSDAQVEAIAQEINNSIQNFNLDNLSDKYRDRHPAGNYYVPHPKYNPGTHKMLPDINQEPSLYFHPPVIDKPYCTSGFSMRKPPTDPTKPIRPHQGVDIVTLGSEKKYNGPGKYARVDSNGRRVGGVTPIFCPEDGVVVQSNKHATYYVIEHTQKTPEGNKIFTTYVHGATRAQYDWEYMKTLKDRHGSKMLIDEKRMVKSGDQVKRGDIFMIMGNTGGSTGTHLHMEVWVVEDGWGLDGKAKKAMKAAPIDPWIVLNARKDNASQIVPHDMEAEATADPLEENDYDNTGKFDMRVEHNNNPMMLDGGPTSVEVPWYEMSAEEKREVGSIKTEGQKKSDNELVIEAREEYGERLTSAEEMESLIRSYGKEAMDAYEHYLTTEVALTISGYNPYTEDYRATNVWYRPQVLAFDNPEGSALNTILKESKPYKFSESINRDKKLLMEVEKFSRSALERKGIVVTALGASMQHIVANIPLVGLEHPTNQHLGSIEPSYFMELTALSDSVDSLNADGLDPEAQILLSVQNILQSNAKVFRAVPDSHSLIIDSFITRLMGTYKVRDVSVTEDTGHIKLYKRNLFSNMNISTVPGSPGAHNVYLQFSETNPYSTVENINAFEESSTDLSHDDIKEALNRVRNMQLEEHGKIALMLHLFGKVRTGEEVKELYKEKKDITFRDEGGLDAYEAGKYFSEFKTEKVEILTYTGKGKPLSSDQLNRAVEFYTKEYMKEQGWSTLGAVSVGTIGVIGAIFAQKFAFGKVVGVLANPIARWTTRGVQFTAGAATGLYGLKWTVDAATAEYQEVTEEDLEEALDYIEDKLRKDGYRREEQEVMVSNGPISNDVLSLMDIEGIEAQSLPDGRMAVSGKALNTFRNHYEYFEKENFSGLTPNKSSLSGYSIGANAKEKERENEKAFGVNVSDFVNSYPQYRSLLFKGEEIDEFFLKAKEVNNTGIANIVQMHKAIMHIEELAPLMLAEEEMGGLPEKEIKEKTYDIIKDEYVDNGLEGYDFFGNPMGGKVLIKASSAMFSGFLKYIHSWLYRNVSNEAATSYTDGIFSELSSKLGWTQIEIDRLFNENLHIHNSVTGKYQDFPRTAKANLPPLTEGKIIATVDDNSDWTLDRKLLNNGMKADVWGGGNRLIFGGDGDNHWRESVGSRADALNDLLQASGGAGFNGKIEKLQDFYLARQNLVLGYIDLNLDRGAYGITEKVINTYLPFLGGLLNVFKKGGDVYLAEAGFTGFYGYFNEIVKYLLSPRDVGNIAAWRKYKYGYEEGISASGTAGHIIQDVLVNNVGSALDVFGVYSAGAWGVGKVSTKKPPTASAVARRFWPVALGIGIYQSATAVMEDGSAIAESSLVQDYYGRLGDRGAQDFLRNPYGSLFSEDIVAASAPNFSSDFLNFLEVDETGAVKQGEPRIKKFAQIKRTSRAGKSLTEEQEDEFEDEGEWTENYGIYGQYDKRIMKKSPFVIDLQSIVNQGIERAKLAFVKQQLYAIGTNILMDPEVAFAIGMEGTYREGLVADEYVGAACYPDIDLPRHPYYDDEKSYAMSPDFYMWNIYEDAPGGLSQDVKDIVYKGAEIAINNSVNFFNSLQKDGIRAKNDFSLNITGPNHQSSKIPRQIKSHFEAAEITTNVKQDGSYETGTPYLNAFSGGAIDDDTDVLEYLKTHNEKGIKALEEKIVEKEEEVKSLSHKALTSREYKKQSNLLNSYRDKLNYIKNLTGDSRDYKYVGKLSNWHFNPQYLSLQEQDSLQNYAMLHQKAISIEKMFGAKAGYTGEYISENFSSTSAAFAETADTALAAHNAWSHQFDKKSIIKLAKDSTHDILTEKYRMKRAYPTFKLFFIEEDEFESRFVNYDDFYTYNGVKEFTIHRSRKLPGDTATIVLQNVGGTLDGTKRNVYKDIDYFKKEKRGEIKRELGDVQVLADNNEMKPEKDQPFGSIVMRPGLNVQLRCGYSNDPNMLEVMISGRVTEVSWGKASDICEITIQSFGTELSQYVKTSDKTFYSTHQLLGALMLEPELRHFGRWEFGQLRQDGENKDSTVDFYDYAQNSEIANWGIVNGAGDFFKNNFGKIFIATATIIAVSIAIRSGKFGAVDDIAKAQKLALAGGKIAASTGATGRIGALATWFGKTLEWAFIPAGIRAAQAAKGPLSGNIVQRVISAMKMAPRLGGKTGRAMFAQSAVAIRSAIGGDLYAASGLLKAHRAIAAAIAKGQPVTAAMRLNYVNAINRANQLAVAGSHYTGLARLVRYGPLSSRGLGGLGSMGWRSFWDVLNGTLRFQLLLGAAAWGMNFVYNKVKRDDILGINAIRKFYARQRARVVLSPADDNLYPPNPLSYLRYDFMDEEKDSWSGWAADNIFALMNFIQLDSTVASMIPVKTNIDPEYPGALREIYNHWTNPKAYVLNKRLTVDQTQYFIENTRIWDIFHEMTLRHPGWIYSCVPYGHEFRYTMFFGIPSQRYWSRPGKPFFINRINNLRGYLLKEQTNLAVIEKSWKELYGEKSWTEAEKDVRGGYVYAPSYDESGKFKGNVTTDINTGMQYPDIKLGEPIGASSDPYDRSTVVFKETEELDTMRLELKLRGKIIKEYLLGLENRFIPFRRYHYLTSEEDIVANNIMGSEHNVVNGVNVNYYTPSGDAPFSSVKMKASSSIPDNKINMANVDFGKNVRGYTMALRYGMGSLIYGMKEIYRGELLVLGNPRIKPWDICIIFDRYNSMCGPVEVEAVTHMFSHETGFLTEIVPNALVIGNEISTYPVLDALKIMIAATQSMKSGKSFEMVNDEMTEDGTLEIVGLDPAWNEELNRKFVSFSDEYNKGSFDLKTILGETGNSNTTIFRSNNTSVTDTVASTADKVITIGATGYGTYNGLGVGMSFGAGGVFMSHMIGNTNWGRSANFSTAKNWVSSTITQGENLIKGGSNARGGGTIMKGIAGAPFAYGGAGVAKTARGLSTLKGGGLFFGATAFLGALGGGIMGYSMAQDPNNLWLTAAPMILTKLTEAEAVIIVPLLKENKPIIGGISFKDPMSGWRSVFGNIYNEAVDYVIGAHDYITESMRFGDTWWANIESGVKGSNDFRNSLAGTYFKAATYWDAFFHRQNL